MSSTTGLYPTFTEKLLTLPYGRTGLQWYNEDSLLTPQRLRLVYVRLYRCLDGSTHQRHPLLFLFYENFSNQIHPFRNISSLHEKSHPSGKHGDRHGKLQRSKPTLPSTSPCSSNSFRSVDASRSQRWLQHILRPAKSSAAGDVFLVFIGWHGEQHHVLARTRFSR